jgi:hypothetical protein
MARCFVIQPFDNGGPYDKRYNDVLVPAIKEGGRANGNNATNQLASATHVVAS